MANKKGKVKQIVGLEYWLAEMGLSHVKILGLSFSKHGRWVFLRGEFFDWWKPIDRHVKLSTLDLCKPKLAV